jgi:hypothetical protein
MVYMHGLLHFGGKFSVKTASPGRGGRDFRFFCVATTRAGFRRETGFSEGIQDALTFEGLNGV